MSNPGKIHWLTMKWLIRYIGYTIDMSIVYKKHGDQADFASDRDSRKLTTTYFFKVCGNRVSWKSQLQPTVALSTTEVEYIAAIEAKKEGV